MDTPRYSIVMPIYGVEAFLPQAIESVRSQRVASWELILVDDGSRDRCAQICDRYAALDPRIAVIHKPNGGLVSARQAGIERCRGEYVLQLDGDDFWSADLLQSIDEVAAQYHPDCILFSYRTVREDGTPVRAYHNQLAQGLYSGEGMQAVWDRMLYDPQDPELNDNIGSFDHGICAAAFRREAVTPFQLLVPRQIGMGEDAAVTIPAVCSCKRLYALDKAMYYYRLRGQSMVRTFNRSEMEGRKHLIAHLKATARQLPPRNLNGYLYRIMDIYWVKAARSLGTYREFKGCVQESLQLLDQQVWEDMARAALKPRFRARLLIMKHKWWIVFWLYYHRGHRKGR